MLPLFALACWALLIRHLSPEWTVNEQYHFGWLVPFLAAYLIKVRSENPPPAHPPQRHLIADLTLLTLAGASVVLMPIREANLDWRLVEWGLVSIAIAASLLCAWHLGSWPWVRHFSFPLLFFLIAVPLPRNLEYPWMDRLMLNNANYSVETLHWLGVECTARGNLIQLPTGILGVEEACSGIRSLQSTLMLSLFLGEILALNWPRRLILLAAGVGWALLTNVLRTSALGWLAARDGLPAVDRWHDVAGYSVLAFSAVTVAFTAWLLSRRSSEKSERLQPSPAIDFSSRFRPAASCAGAGIAVLLVGLWVNQWWFDLHERPLTAVTEWDFRLPSDAPTYREVPIAERTRKLLNYNEGYSGAWRDDSGSQWQAYFFRWDSGRNAGQTAMPHDPRRCLGAVGMELSAVLPSVTFSRRDVQLTFDAFEFLNRGRLLYVFNCLAEDVRTADRPREVLEVNSPAMRLQAALAGRRQAGQRRLEVAVADAPDAATAVRKFSALLDQRIQLADAATSSQSLR
jgi:exosortase